MSVKDQFNRLRKDPDFIEAYNDFNGTNYTELTTGQLFSVGTLFHLVQIKMHNGTELLLTDAYYDLQYQGKNYIAAGDFTDISLIRTKALNRADVKIDICFLNPNTGSPTESFNLFTGSMDKLTVNIEYDDNEAKNETEAVMNSIWEVLEKSARNHASDGVHRSYPGNEQDTFFSRIRKWNSESKWTSVK